MKNFLGINLEVMFLNKKQLKKLNRKEEYEIAALIRDKIKNIDD